MNFTPEQYDKIINILNRNPLATYNEIESNLDNCSKSDICNLFKEIRQEYTSEKAVEQFLENNASNKDPILFVNGILKSLCKDEIDQSLNIGAVFNNIASTYEDMEKNNENEVKYSTIYRYFSALMLNEKLPKLNSTESALLLCVMFEVINFSEEMLSQRPEDYQKFMDKIYFQLGQFLVKSTIPEENWNEQNQEELINVFNIPQVNFTEMENDEASAYKKLQKDVAWFSLNPFHMSANEIVPFQTMVENIYEDDKKNGRDIKLFQDRLDVDLMNVTVCAEMNRGSKMIVHQKQIERKSSQIGGRQKRTNKEVEIENQIYEKISRHDIIDVEKYQNSLAAVAPKKKK